MSILLSLLLILIMIVLPLYFVYVHPLIVTYQGGLAPDPSRATMAFYLGIALWMIVLGYILYLLVLRPIYQHHRLRRWRRTTPLREARIIRVMERPSSPQNNLRKLVLECENYAGTTIHYQHVLFLPPGKERDFEEGKTLSVLLNPFKSGKALYWEHESFSSWISPLLGLIATIANIAYASFSYQYYRQHAAYIDDIDAGKFLYYTHGWLMSPIFLVLVMVLYKKLIPHLMRQQLKHHSLLAYGIKVIGTCRYVRQSGLLIDDVPQYKIGLEFIDQAGKEQRIEIKKTIPDSVDKPLAGHELELLYHRDHPREAILYQNYLNEVLDAF